MNSFSIKTYRRALQISVALSFVVLPYLNRQRINFFYGNFLSFNAAGLPLADPLAVLQVARKSTQLAGVLLDGAGIAEVSTDAERVAHLAELAAEAERIFEAIEARAIPAPRQSRRGRWN